MDTRLGLSELTTPIGERGTERVNSVTESYLKSQAANK
jgi:hypothetical protein